MRKIKILLLGLAGSIGAMGADYDVTPGALGDLMEGLTDSELKLTGRIDARDLAAMEKLPTGVTSLDLSGVKIDALTTPSRKYFGRTLFKEGELPAYTFFKTGVETLILPADVKTIGEGAFAGAAVRRMEIPEGVTAIGDYAFFGCADLESVSLPSTVKSIGKNAFGDCRSLRSIDLSKTGITEVPERAFAGSLELEELTLPAGVEKVGREAFAFTAIKSLNLQGVTEYDDYALSGMPYLESLTLNPDAASEGLLMDDTSLSSLTGVPEFVPAFFAANCGSLPTADVTDTAMELGAYAVANTLSPERLFLPEGLARIERGALSGLGNIETIDVTALGRAVPEVDATTFEGLDRENIILWVDDNAFDDWESHPEWSLFKVMSERQTGIDDITADSGSDLTIRTSGGLITVESDADLVDVRIYTADGRMVYVATPGTPRVEIERASLPAGIVIVTGADAEGRSGTVSVLN